MQGFCLVSNGYCKKAKPTNIPMVYQKGQKAPKWSTTRCTPILIYTSTSKYRRARLYLDVDV